MGMHQGSVLSTYLFALVVDVVAEFAREGELSELLYVDDLVLMSETIDGLRDKFLKWKETFESKGLKVNLGKTKVMVSSSIAQDGLSKSKVDPCRVCKLRVKANSALCAQCERWVHCRYAGMNRVTPKYSRNSTCSKCDRNIGEVVEQEEKLCGTVQWKLQEFTYLGDRVSVGGGHEAAVTARTRCGWVKFMESCELLHGRRFPLKLKEDAYGSYVRLAMLHGSEAWCLKESEMGIL